jgi:hypothetical protein
MGTEGSANDEWIELYNNSSSSIDLGGWEIISNDKTPSIVLKNRILAKGFFILERTDDTTLPKIKSDLIYKGNLSNNGEYLKLIDNNKKIIDEVDCLKKWFFGNNEIKKTMERKNTLIEGDNSENWQTSENPGGTPDCKNSEGQKIKEKIASSSMRQNSQETTITKEKTQNPFFSFLIALSVATSSGAFVLFLKKKIEKEY